MLCAGARFGATLLQCSTIVPHPRFLERDLRRLARIGFVGLGVWAGTKLTPKRPPGDGFARNEAAIRSLGLSPRECEVLELLASGQSNKEMARTLSISPNTVKTHIARVYEKLEVDRRIQAIGKHAAALIP